MTRDVVNHNKIPIEYLASAAVGIDTLTKICYALQDPYILIKIFHFISSMILVSLHNLSINQCHTLC